MRENNTCLDTHTQLVLGMGCSNTKSPVEQFTGKDQKARKSTVDIFMKRTQTELQQHAVDLRTPKENQKIRHEILGTFNSDSVSNIDIIVTDTG